MVKQTQKRLTALLLSIAMAFSMVADVLPTAYAAGERDSASSTDWNFGDNTATGRPRLFVDFLGDNGKAGSGDYRATAGEALDGDKLATPGLEDQSNITNPDKGYKWEGYKQADTTSGETIFWVGVGVDKMKVLDLFEKDDRGIYSLELGFYYDSSIIEPYAGAGGDYLRMMQKANLENYAHRWGDQYQIVAAETGLDPQVDVVTQETLTRPSIDNILGNATHQKADWKMTYVSLEKREDATEPNRFHGENQKGTREETQYLLLIPFRLKGYAPVYDRHSVGDENFNVCLRLIRNASLFSIGGGLDGVEPYGAWERVTTRNPGRDLKLMTEFQGDLDIFGGNRHLENSYQANLLIEGTYYGTGNAAELYITDDPSPTKGKINTPGSKITGLYDGTGLTLDVTCQTIYNVEVWVTPQGGDKSTAYLIPLGKTVESDILNHYTFIMPDQNVDVHVVFSLNPDVTDFWLYLNETHTPDDQDRAITGNSTVVTATYTDATATPPTTTVTTVDKDSPVGPLNLPAQKVHMGAGVEVEVKVHHDYEAYVEVVNVQTRRRIGLEDLPADYIPDTDTATDTDRHLAVTLPTGGKFKVTGGMPQSDIEVRVTYRPATRYRATLEVWHEDAAPISENNVAQLESTVYTGDDAPMEAYSGVVYQDAKKTDDRTDDDHSAVKGTFRVLERVDASSAALSGCLGGDGREAIGWDTDGKSLMAALWDVISRSASITSPTTSADLGNYIEALDLRRQYVKTTAGVGVQPDGLRKNVKGEFYTDSDIDLFYDRLFALGKLAQAAGLQANKPEPADATKTFTYFDLTPAQVQMYLLDCEAAADPSTVTIRTTTDAATELAKPEYIWFEPSATTVPPTANTTAYLDVRGGRRVTITLEADSAYTTLRTVELLDSTTKVLITTVQPQQDADYQNVYYFDMPEQDCIVKVTYTERAVHPLGLTIDGDGGEAGNQANVSAYIPKPGSRTPELKNINTHGSRIDNVLEGSVVTVDLKVADGYEVWVDVVRGAPGSYQSVYSLSPTDKDTTFTFVMPAEEAEVQVHYRQTDKKRNNANVVLTYYSGSTSDSGNQAYWDGTSPHSTRKASVEGEVLKANISVAKNYYIYAVRTYTTDTSEVSPGPYVGAGYPFLLSGNGWNNGQGGDVTIDTVMPDMEYWVEVILREGPPVEEPEQPLTLLVVDDDNSAAPLADNWAQATTVTGGAVSVGPAGKTQAGGVYATGFVKAGELVEVEFHPATGYYVDTVEVQPASLGVAVAWTSATKAEFYMPAGSAAVVVTFKKDTGNLDDQTKLFLDLDKTEQGTTAEPTSPVNTIVSFQSPTTNKIPGLTGGLYVLPATDPLPGRYPTGGDSTTGAARPGELVTLNIDVAEGWYIHSLTVNGSDGRLIYTLSGNGYSTSGKGSAVATFIMPHSDASVVVNYRKGEPPAQKTDYVMELRVDDPENLGDPLADNWAQVNLVGENGSSSLGPVGKTRTPDQMWAMDYAQEGDTVTISYEADAGFALDVIIVSSDGRRVPVTYLGGSVATFTMPAGDVTALVRFKKGEPNQYTANLVLHMPSGTALEDYDSVGEGSFGADLVQKIYSMTAIPGQNIDLALWAKDGYFIRTVTVAPEALGVEATYSGAFGRQSGELVMPAGNIQVNVFFEKGWPDTVKDYPDTVNYDLTLKVFDIPGSGGAANFRSIAGVDLGSPESDPVVGGGQKTLKNRAYDDDLVEVAVKPVAGYVPQITVTDSRDVSVPWRYVPGGIAFEMTPAHVTVVVRYEKIPEDYNPNDPNNRREVTLHIRGGDTTDRASVTYQGTIIDRDGDSMFLPDLPGGQTLTFSATPGTGHSIAAAYAVSRRGGEQLIIPVPFIPDGGTVDFAMPRMDDADVYVVFDDAMAPPSDDQRLGTLVVAGPAGSGSARMKTTATGAKTDTGLVTAAGAGSLFVPQDTLLTVDLTVNTGYSIGAIRVTDGQGRPLPYTWTDGSQRQFTLTMPATGARVYVEYVDVSAVPQTLTAQVVVNYGKNAGNTAKLRRSGAAVGGSAYLSGLKPGDVIDLDLVVQPGSEIEYIKVTPVKYGIAPSLYKPATEDQTTSFTMPGEDVVIYVRFKEDTRFRRPVTLVVQGDGTAGNQAYIHSDYSGSKGPVTPGNSDVVRAAPPTATLPAEWVTVDYEWADGRSIKSITVVDTNGTPVPFTTNQNDPSRKGQLTFPMVDSDVTVTIVYQNDPNPPTYDAVLHVIDLDDPATSDDSWGKLTWTGTGVWAGAGTTTDEIHSFTQSTANPTLGPGEEILKVPGGEIVTVDALAQSGTYIKAAYVLYRSIGQMIDFNFGLPNGTTGFQGGQQDTFVMPYGQVDVYVYFTRTPPETNDYAAVLMLDSPSGDTASTATITNENATTTQIPTATVTANTPPDHGFVTAKDGNTIKVTVNPATGYVIDSVLMTPLGIAVEQGGSVALTKQPDGSYTFTMPAQNVAVRVKLRRGSSGEYRATLHYRMWTGDPVADPEKDWAMLSFADDSNPARWNIDGEFRMVPERAEVTLGVSMDDPNVVLSAYVLQANGGMVPFTKPPLEGTKEGNSKVDDTLTDGETTFVMPAADVDVFVWFIRKDDPDYPKVDKWHTAVLTVTDDDGAGNLNSGKNSATIESDKHNTVATEVKSNGVVKRGTTTGNVSMGDVAEHSFLWVEEGETVKVAIKTIDPDYDFVPPVNVTRSDSSAAVVPTVDNTNRPYYVYTYPVENYNTAARAHFTASTQKESALNVVIIDKDNPGNGKVSNSVRVEPGTLPALTVISTTSAGARQRVPGVQSSTVVKFQAKPQSTEYTAQIRLLDSSGAVLRVWNTYVDQFVMPNEAATLEVTFYKGRRATLTVWDTRGVTTTVDGEVSTAQMVESAFDGSVTADSTRVPNGFDALPDGTVLAASITELADDTKLIGALEIYPDGSARWIKATSVADSPDEYRHVISGSDVEIRMVVGPATSNDYLATVSPVNLPDLTPIPTIYTTGTPTPYSGWTKATAGDTVTVALEVPYGYKAVVTSNDVILGGTPPIEVDGPSSAGAGNVSDTVTFTMPAGNVHVTVTYVKTRFTATITTAGDGSGSASLTATLRSGGSQSVDATGTISDLLGGEKLDYTATADAGSTIAAIIMQTAGGTTRRLSHTDGTGSDTMPDDDVTITVVFNKQQIVTHHLDLHVSGTEGGTATLVATNGGAAVGTLTSTPADPRGFSRLDAVETGSDMVLTVQPESGYLVTLGYYLHSGGALSYVTDTVTPSTDTDGEVTFVMPNSSTCIYVTFQKAEDPPEIGTDTPENPDPNHYLDLHVNGTGGGTAVMTAAGTTVQSTPVNPRSVSTIQPIGTGTEVALTVMPEAGYTVMVSYYVYRNGTPVPTVLTQIPAAGTGATPVTFTMPDQSACVYVTFRAPDRLPYLDLHVNNPAGGEAVLTTDGFGERYSRPTDQHAYSRIERVETGTPVTLNVKPEADYTVTVSYYRHGSGGNLYYTSYLIDTGNGGKATFDMPGDSTCIYVTFNGPGSEPSPDPDELDKYLDLHVSETQGGSVTLTPDGMTSMSSSPDAPNSYDQRKPVAAATNVTMTVTPEPGYTVSVSYYVHNGGVPVPTELTNIPSTGTGATPVTFPMPNQSTCVYVTFKRTENPDDPNKYLDLHVSGLANGSTTLTTTETTPRSVSSTPAAPRSVSTIQPVTEGTLVTLSVTPEKGCAVTVSYYVHNNGSFTYTSYQIDNDKGGTATFNMPAESTCIYVHFHQPTDPPDPDPDPIDPPEPPEQMYIAYVTVVGGDGLPLNTAQNIVDTTQSLGGGVLWAYGKTGDEMLTTFTVAPEYTAKVTAKRLDTNTAITVAQQGTTNTATARVTMPDSDVEVTITYYGPDDPQPVNDQHKLTLRLVGHGGEHGNYAVLQGGDSRLELHGDKDPSGNDVTVDTKATLGTALDLDANRRNDYIFVQATLEYTDAAGTHKIKLNLNEYGTNATSLLFMPDADAVVTVYYRLPYKATLFVVDAQGKDFDQGAAGDTTGESASGKVPKTELSVTNTSGTQADGSPTYLTHTPITGLIGNEMTTTTVDNVAMTAGGTMPDGVGVASVIATTYSGSTVMGTVHLAEKTAGTGVYEYPMSETGRPAADVDITVVLRDNTLPLMYTATVYKVNHDDEPGNNATITNDTTNTVPNGTIWTGAYATNKLHVDVTTATGYYAVVTAVNVSTGAAVPVLQWTATGPFAAELTMPAADVDITVTYSKDPPKAPLVLRLTGHGQMADNKAMVNNKTSGSLIPTLSLNGLGAADPVDKVSDVPVQGGTSLEVLAGIAAGYHVESIVLTVPGLPDIPLTLSATNSADTLMPVLGGGGQAVITVKFAEGEKTPRPFDPEHSTIYYGPGKDPNGNYPTTDDTNPDLSNPTQEGWILAEMDGTLENTIVVTIPTLYEYDAAKTPPDILADAGVDEITVVDPMPVPPTYKFYWIDSTGAERELDSTQMTRSGDTSLSYTNNPKGNYPAGSQHYGYQTKLTAKAETDLETYIQGGGTIYVTATYPASKDPGSWVESEKTQVIIPAPNYTATLHIVDVSSSLKNEVEMSVKDDASYTPVNTDGGKIEKLHGKETLLTKVTRGDDDVKVVSVLAIPKKGSPTYLSPEIASVNPSTYPFDMVRDDVDIVVTLANGEDKLYTAAVVKKDLTNEPKNTVEISNPTHPVLNRDTNDPARWTLAYEKDEIRVDVKAMPGYRVSVTAQTVDGTPLAVSPTSGGGTMVVTLPNKMPASNIKITVTFEKVEQEDQGWVTLRMRMDSENGTLPIAPGNKAEAFTGGTAVLVANSVNGYTNTQLLTATGLDITATLADGYAVQEWFVNGISQTSLGTNTNVTIPIPVPTGITNTVITVVLTETKVEGRTPRPFDPAHSVKYPAAEDHINHDGHTGHIGPGGHQDGYLMAKNLGSSKVQITVPNLYNMALEAAENVTYQLYARIGGQMVLLDPGTDYDVVVPTQTLTVSHSSDGTDTWYGQTFTIQSLDPNGALGDYVKNGGVIYITATDIVTPKDESAFTEVVLPADPNKDTGYTVTLMVIDDTTGKTNSARMQDANHSTNPAATISWTGVGPVAPTVVGTITGLLGGELIRTEVEPADGVTYTVMAHTKSMGDVLLFPDPTGTDRYRKGMPTEDMIITVHFHDEGDPDDPDHVHIAVVEKRGATAVPENLVTIVNGTDNKDGTLDLKYGDIWTEGHDKDTIQVHVETAEGYYATVTMRYVDPDTNTQVTNTPVTRGEGNGTDIDVTFDMPHADVQVEVLFEAGQKSPRPFDPRHSEKYYGDVYQHYTVDNPPERTPENQSTTDQEGWLLGENLGGGAALVTVPTLWSTDGGLENATGAGFRFYLPEKDPSGAYTGYILLEEGVDYTLANSNPDYTGTDVFTVVKENYRYDPNDSTKVKDFDGVTFRLLEKAGGKLDKLLDSGLSLFVTATKTAPSVLPWLESDITELVIPALETGLRPYDPDRVNAADVTDPTYEDHWIRAENRGDYLIVTVPVLADRVDDLFDVESKDEKQHSFKLYLQEDGTDKTSDTVDVTNLLKFTNSDAFFDENWVATGAYPSEADYALDVYYTGATHADGSDYYGAKFVVEILTPDEIRNLGLDSAAEKAALDNAKILQEIFDNKGTMGEDKYRMYITATETLLEDDGSGTMEVKSQMESRLVDFEVPRYYTFHGILESYAPKHTATFSFYPWLGTDETDPTDYETEPSLVYHQIRTFGTGLWQLDFEIKSSELMGEDREGQTYKLVINKPGHVTYEWLALYLGPETLDEPNGLVFTVAAYDDAGDLDDTTVGIIALFGGDIDDDGTVTLQDREVLIDYTGGKRTYTTTQVKTDPDYGDSIYNPSSLAHAADLDGDGRLNVMDLSIIMEDRNYNKRFEDYPPVPGLRGAPVTVAVEALVLLEELQPEEVLSPEGDPAAGEETELPDGEIKEPSDEEGKESPADPLPDDSKEEAPPEETEPQEPGEGEATDNPDNKGPGEQEPPPQDPEQPEEKEDDTAPKEPIEGEETEKGPEDQKEQENLENGETEGKEPPEENPVQEPTVESTALGDTAKDIEQLPGQQKSENELE